MHNYTFLHTQAQDLTARVAEHFGEDGADIVVDLDVAPHRGAHQRRRQHRPRPDEDGHGLPGPRRPARQLRRLLMFGMLGRMAGLAMANPATIVIGLFMGRSALRGEKERQLNMRRGQARQAASTPTR